MSSKKRGENDNKRADAPKSGFAKRLTSLIPWKKQGEMAAKLGVDISTLGRWARGEQKPAHENVLRLAEVLHVDIGWLLKGEGPKPDVRVPVVGRATPGPLAAEWPGDEDLITQRIKALEAVSPAGQTGRDEMAAELLLMTARRVTVLEREVAELLRLYRERRPPGLDGAQAR